MADYDVVLLIEEELTDADARQVRSLHEGLDDPVTYHVLLPADDAAAQVEASMGAISPGSDLMTGTQVPLSSVDLQAVREDSRERSQQQLTDTVAVLERAGATVASSEIVSGPPIDALGVKIAAVDGREAIILTRPHVVAGFFHVDWTSQARRKLGVPVLHLLEHETFDEQGEGPGEGVTGL
jgi:hypothetical protein